MSEPRDLAEAHVRAYNERAWDRASQIYAPDLVVAEPAGTTRGIDAFLGHSRGFAAAFPDSRMEVTTIIESGHHVAVEGVYSGTHTGPLATPQGEVPPTARTLRLPICLVFEVAAGRITRNHVYYDQMTFAAQLGLLPAPGPAAENKAMVRRVFEAAVNAGDDAVIDELLAADYVNHDMPAPAPGAEGFKQIVAQFRAAFPDLTVTIEDEFADGDLAGTRGRFTGTHKGDFMGFPASGHAIDVKYIDLWRVRDGKLAENWVQMDTAGLMQQIGAMPGA